MRALVRSRGLGDVYKRQVFLAAAQGRSVDQRRAELVDLHHKGVVALLPAVSARRGHRVGKGRGGAGQCGVCLLYTSDAADDLLCVDLGGRRLLKKKKKKK